VKLPRVFAAARSPDFRLFWASNSVVLGGYWVSWVSMQLIISRLTNAASSAVGLLTFFSLVPMLLLLPYAGVIADRYERRRVLQTSQLGLALVAALLALVGIFHLTSVPLIYALAFALGVGQAMGAPAMQALVADAVPREDLVSAVSLTSVTLNVARMVFPVAALPLVVWGGPQAAFALYAVAALSSVVLIGRVRMPRHVVTDTDFRFWSRLRHGWLHVRERPPATTVLSMVAVTGLFTSCMTAYSPVIATQILHRGDSGFFALTAAIGIGAAIGAFSVGFLSNGMRLWQQTVLMLGAALSFCVVGVLTDFVATLAVVVVYGALLFATQTMLATTLQFLIEDSARGRVMSLYQLGWAGLIPIGSLGIGLLGSAIGPSRAMVAFGTVASAYALVLLVRERARPALIVSPAR